LVNPHGRIIEVGHLIAACDGDPEKLAGLSVMIALASYALGHMEGRARLSAEAIAPAQVETANAQLRTWGAATEEIQKLLWRARSH
jgi:hypothetical protein